MVQPLPLECSDSLCERDTWASLKRVIVASSGFRRWQQERNPTDAAERSDELVRAYLRETLATLAY